MRINILGSRIRIKSVGIRKTAESRTFVTLLIFEAKTASPVRTGGAGTAVDLCQLSILPAPTIKYALTTISLVIKNINTGHLLCSVAAPDIAKM